MTVASLPFWEQFPGENLQDIWDQSFFHDPTCQEEMPPSHGFTDSTQPPHQMIGRGLGVTGSQAVLRTLNAWGRVSLSLPHPVWVLVAELGGRERGQVSVAWGGEAGLGSPPLLLGCMTLGKGQGVSLRVLGRSPLCSTGRL